MAPQQLLWCLANIQVAPGRSQAQGKACDNVQGSQLSHPELLPFSRRAHRGLSHEREQSSQGGRGRRKVEPGVASGQREECMLFSLGYFDSPLKTMINVTAATSLPYSRHCSVAAPAFIPLVFVGYTFRKIILLLHAA